MLNFLNLKPEFFGLDISDLSLKIASLKKWGNSLKLASFLESQIKPGVISGGEIKDEKLLTNSLKEAFNKVEGDKLRTKYVVASLPEEKAFLQVIQLPPMPLSDLDSAIVYESENYIPLAIDQVYLDYQVIPSLDADRLDVLLAALPKYIVDSYLRVLKSAGLKPLALEIESLAIARALLGKEKAGQPVLLIDLGATRTSFIVFYESSVKFTSSIPVSGLHFTGIIAKALGVKEEEAEKLKIKYGLTGRDSRNQKDRGEIFEALVPALVDLTQQIKKYLNYYQTHPLYDHSGKSIKEISGLVLVGGGANLKGLPELLSLELNLPVKIGDPWQGILAAKDHSLGYATAIGLALRGLSI